METTDRLRWALPLSYILDSRCRVTGCGPCGACPTTRVAQSSAQSDLFTHITCLCCFSLLVAAFETCTANLIRIFPPSTAYDAGRTPGTIHHKRLHQ
jgi:hypothetical protein